MTDLLLKLEALSTLISQNEIWTREEIKHLLAITKSNKTEDHRCSLCIRFEIEIRNQRKLLGNKKK